MAVEDGLSRSSPPETSFPLVFNLNHVHVHDCISMYLNYIRKDQAS